MRQGSSGKTTTTPEHLYSRTRTRPPLHLNSWHGETMQEGGRSDYSDFSKKPNEKQRSTALRVHHSLRDAHVMPRNVMTHS